MKRCSSHRRSRWRWAALFAGAAAISPACGGSSLTPEICDRSEGGNPPVVYTDGTVEDGIYMSSAWDGELLYFPGGMRYEIRHKLGQVPRFWQFYLSFDDKGTKKGVLALAAGNQAELRAIDSEKLIVVNGSCADYWLLVVAGAGEGPGGLSDEGEDGGAGGGGGGP